MQLADFEYVGKAMISICKEIEEEILANATEENEINEEKASEEAVDSEKATGCWIA